MTTVVYYTMHTRKI